MAVWPTIERFVTEHGAAVLVTVAGVQGSTPRDEGARMIVRPDGGFSGTIGGGTLEWIALAEAQAMMAGKNRENFRKLDKALGPDLGQCCGGRVIVTLEKFAREDLDAIAPLSQAEQAGPLVTISEKSEGLVTRRIADKSEAALARGSYWQLPDKRVIERFDSSVTPLYLFGAGHVGRSLVMALAPLPFAVRWIDPRPNAFPTHIPANVTCVADAEPARLIGEARSGAFIAIMTHSHALDLDIAAAALKAQRFAYVGLIGSDTKRARFVSSLRRLGLAQGDIDRLVCPIGITEITDKSPAAIAASIAAQLLIMKDRAQAAQPVPAASPERGNVRHG